MGIYKFGNNTYPRRIRRRSNLGHIFRGESASYGPGNTVSEILNDSDSDGGSCSEPSDSDTCKVNSPFSSSTEGEEVFRSEPDRGRKRTRKAIPKRANTDSELGWNEQTQTVQKPAFSRVPGIKIPI
jgi:hypothetical protein